SRSPPGWRVWTPSSRTSLTRSAGWPRRSTTTPRRSWRSKSASRRSTGCSAAMATTRRRSWSTASGPLRSLNASTASMKSADVASGADEVVFMFAPNAGEPARSFAKIASCGELSRVALAVKQVLAAADATPTLVFDEVDAGIGGRTADPVGRSLWALARNHQVLVVTHLAQIAAHADAPFRIAKPERAGRTLPEI